MVRSFKQSQRQPIRSFVLRKGRITRAQRRALDELWPVYGINYEHATYDFSSRFGRDAPLVVEIGFGNGDALIAMAKAEPDINFLGIEVYRPGLGAVLAGIRAASLVNVRLICEDAVAVLEHMVADTSLSGLRLFFPDPWPKKRHHKRRLVQAGFLEMLAGKLTRGAVIHMVTDWQDYADQMLTLLRKTPQFINAAPDGGFSRRPASRPLTHFEKRGTRLGHDVWDILFTRC